MHAAVNRHTCCYSANQIANSFSPRSTVLLRAVRETEGEERLGEMTEVAQFHIACSKKKQVDRKNEDLVLIYGSQTLNMLIRCSQGPF